VADVLDAEKLKDWKEYRNWLKAELQRLAPGEPIYVTKKKFDFDMDGKKFPGFALLPGKRAKMSFMKCRQGGIQFYEGSCELEGKTILITGLDNRTACIKGAQKTFLKLRLGWKVGVQRR